ncbi:hypothetical protein [Erysipelothrix larvae]|uniref:hypothetical protein n=1 Tax=Erysipelothrix larvae TaxID=1514105 RepID=UPI0012FE728D|nr:hypothetical protein [Erysipelothrix larvae]
MTIKTYTTAQALLKHREDQRVGGTHLFIEGVAVSDFSSHDTIHIDILSSPNRWLWFIEPIKVFFQ